MNAADHQAEAARLIDQAHAQQEMNGPGCGSEELLVEAQVHATLAVALEQRNTNVWLQEVGDQFNSLGPIELQIDGKALARVVNEHNRRDQRVRQPRPEGG